MEGAGSGIFIGIDWSDGKHDVCIREGDRHISHEVIEQSPESIEGWVMSLRKRYPERSFSVCLEQSRGALIYALLKYDCFVLYPINPSTLAKYREAFRPNRGKDDKSDADFLAELVSMHRNRLRRWEPDDKQTRELQQLVEFRRKLVSERTRISNRLTAYLKSYFPQVLSWFPDLKTYLVCDYLERWSTLEAVQTESPETLLKFFCEHGSRSKRLNQRRMEEITVAVPLVTDEAIVEATALIVRALAMQLRTVMDSIAMFDKKIAEVCKVHDDYQIFASFPGAGAALAPRMLAAFGTNRERFESAREAQQLFGIAPLIEASGKQRWVRWRYFCPRFLRQSFHEFANESIKQSVWAKAYYHQARARGKKHHIAIRALAFKWLRIMWRCWKNNEPYDEARYLKAINFQQTA
jgi:transposase